jgi:hypothetical protein
MRRCRRPEAARLRRIDAKMLAGHRKDSGVFIFPQKVFRVAYKGRR